MALKTAFKTVKFYAARQGLHVRRVVSGCVLQLNLVDETGVLSNVVYEIESENYSSRLIC